MKETTPAEPVGPIWLDFWFDHGAEGPLWAEHTAGAELARLPLSEGVRADLRDLQHRWQADHDWVESPGSDPAWQRFLAECRLVFDRVRAQLPPEWLLTSSLLDDEWDTVRAELRRRTEVRAHLCPADRFPHTARARQEQAWPGRCAQ